MNSHHNLNCKIRAEESQIRGETDVGNSRLIIPIIVEASIKENPQEQKPFTILAVQSKLLTQISCRIADGIFKLEPQTMNQGFSWTFYLQFPLSQCQVYEIENIRNGGDLKFNLDLELIIASGNVLNINLNPALPNEKQKPIAKNFLSEFSTSRPNQILQLKIPQSEWVNNILPALGFGKKKLVEIPIPMDSATNEKLVKSVANLEEAQRYFNLGEYNKVIEHCRKAIEPIPSTIPTSVSQIEDKEITFNKKIIEFFKQHFPGLDEEKVKFSKKVISAIWELTSEAVHDRSVDFDRKEAESVMLITAASLSYVGKLLIERRPNSEQLVR